MIPFSVLDLAPIPEGSSATDALRNTLALAQHAERLGFHRYWLAEHHNMPGIASAATAVVIAHVAAGTTSIRVGAGGIMLPNHAPLVIAEQFGTLAALHPGRIDLGLGRAPGTDPATARALRRTLDASVDAFPDDVVELMRYFRPAEPGQQLRAVPADGQQVEFWILGSSLYGAQLAAALGLPFAFAAHFAPAMLREAIGIYRERFRPVGALSQPCVMLAINVFAAATEAMAQLLMTSLLHSFVNLRRGLPGKVPPPQADYAARLSPAEAAMLRQALACTIVGDPAQVRAGLQAFLADTAADELMISSTIFEPEARLRSFEIIADAHHSLAAAP